MDQKSLPINRKILVGTPIGIFQTKTKRNSLKKHFMMSTKMKKITRIKKMMKEKKMRMKIKMKTKMRRIKTTMTMTMTMRRRMIDFCFSDCQRFPSKEEERLPDVNTKKRCLLLIVHLYFLSHLSTIAFCHLKNHKNYSSLPASTVIVALEKYKNESFTLF